MKWPDVKLDYGDVKVADFDRDGNLDIALACHFLRNYVMYGNGKGDFTRVVELPNVNLKFSSRAIGVADFDGDGRQDIAALAELDIDLATNAAVRGALLQVHLNKREGWKVVAVQGTYENLYGDHMAVGDLDGDGKPDIVVSSHKNSNFSLVFLNQGDGDELPPREQSGVPLPRLRVRGGCRGPRRQGGRRGPDGCVPERAARHRHLSP